MLCQLCNVETKIKNDLTSVCPRCRLLYFTSAQSTTYEEDYFNLEYQKQYGKTYFEDKNNLQKRMVERLQKIQQHVQRSQSHLKRILEIGSAAGFFLALAQKENYIVEGWEISHSMSQFANEHDIPTQQGDFLTLYNKYKEGRGLPYDVVCAFYVIEHFSQVKETWQALSDLVLQGGLLCLALPSLDGPMYRLHRRRWLQEHPQDHFVDYSRKSLTQIGQKFGFRLKAISAEGIHPQRFWGGRLPVLGFFYAQLQKKLALSDTIFVIFQKETLP